jgi:hypothetical protein
MCSPWGRRAFTPLERTVEWGCHPSSSADLRRMSMDVWSVLCPLIKARPRAARRRRLCGAVKTAESVTLPHRLGPIFLGWIALHQGATTVVPKRSPVQCNVGRQYAYHTNFYSVICSLVLSHQARHILCLTL